MIRKVAGFVLMSVFIAIFTIAMIYANYVYCYNSGVLVFIGALCAFGFLFAVDVTFETTEDGVNEHEKRG